MRKVIIAGGIAIASIISFLVFVGMPQLTYQEQNPVLSQQQVCDEQNNCSMIYTENIEAKPTLVFKPIYDFKPECKQENSGLKVGDMYCTYKYLGNGQGYWEWQPIPVEQKIPADAECNNAQETRVTQNPDGTTTRFKCVDYKWVPY